ncbi:tetratricopeptide repeat protein [Thiohalorhabdus sp. Cl-TMA]|uniref:Tetratricopeptide repeat protein n=1 Tax=Thiohalorhabdus methylotrophus TaxID=3242694 RepID=A0ABV4TW28_9GAMM
MGVQAAKKPFRAAPAAAVLGGLAALVLGGGSAAAADQAVGVRCGDHGAYFRVVFDLPRSAPLSADPGAGRVALRWQEGWTLEGVEACRRAMAGLTAVERRGADRLEVRYAPSDLEVRTFPLEDPPRWVVDVGRIEGAEGAAPPAAASSGSGGEPPPVPPAPVAGMAEGGVPLPPAIPPQPPKALDEYRKRIQRGGVNEVVAELGAKARDGNAMSPALGFLLGTLHQRQGQELDAGRVLWNTARANPEHPYTTDALRTASKIFNGLGFHYQATKPLEAYLRHYPQDSNRATIQLRLGRLYALGDDPGAARGQLVPLLYQGSKGLQAKARLWLAYLLVEEGQFGEAAKQFRANRETVPGYFSAHPELIAAAGQAEVQGGDAGKALTLLREFSQRFSGHSRYPEALLLQGHAQGRQEAWRKALDLYRKVLGMEVQADLRARARAGVVEALHALGEVKTDSAVARLDTIAEGLPYSRAAWEARHTAARLLEGQERYGRALKQLGTLLGQGRPAERKRLRQRVHGLLPRAMRAKLESGAPFEAFKLFNRHAGDPPPPGAGKYATRALLALGALKAARRTLAEYQEAYGETVQSQRWEYEVAQGYREAGDPAGLAWIDGLLADGADHPWKAELGVERARLLAKLDRHEDLLRYVEKTSGLPGADAARLRARAQEALGRPKSAFRTLDGWLRGAAGSGVPGSLYAEAGDLAARVGQVYDARDYWQKALKAGVPDWQVRQLRVLLGVDALHREDFAGVKEYLKDVEGDGAFARTAATYTALMPMIRERLD